MLPPPRPQPLLGEERDQAAARQYQLPPEKVLSHRPPQVFFLTCGSASPSSTSKLRLNVPWESISISSHNTDRERMRGASLRQLSSLAHLPWPQIEREDEWARIELSGQDEFTMRSVGLGEGKAPYSPRSSAERVRRRGKESKFALGTESDRYSETFF